MQPSLGVFIIVLSVLVLYVWLIRLCLKQLDCFNPEKMMMSFALSFILILCYLVIMTWWMVWVGFDNLIHFIFVSIAIIFCSVFFVVLLASIRFNLVKCLFLGKCSAFGGYAFPFWFSYCKQIPHRQLHSKKACIYTRSHRICCYVSANTGCKQYTYTF